MTSGSNWAMPRMSIWNQPREQNQGGYYRSVVSNPFSYRWVHGSSNSRTVNYRANKWFAKANRNFNPLHTLPMPRPRPQQRFNNPNLVRDGRDLSGTASPANRMSGRSKRRRIYSPQTTGTTIAPNGGRVFVPAGPSVSNPNPWADPGVRRDADDPHPYESNIGGRAGHSVVLGPSGVDVLYRSASSSFPARQTSEPVERVCRTFVNDCSMSHYVDTFQMVGDRVPDPEALLFQGDGRDSASTNMPEPRYTKSYSDPPVFNITDDSLTSASTSLSIYSPEKKEQEVIRLPFTETEKQQEQKVIRLPFPTEFHDSFNSKVSHEKSPPKPDSSTESEANHRQLEQTIDLCDDTTLDLDIIHLEEEVEDEVENEVEDEEMEEGEIKEHKPKKDPKLRKKQPDLPVVTSENLKKAKGPKVLSEVHIIDSDGDDEIEVLEIVSPKVGGVNRKGGRKSGAKGKRGSFSSKGPQKGGFPKRVTPKVDKKLVRREGKTRWGTPLPIRRKSLRISAAAGRKVESSRAKDSPFSMKLASDSAAYINPMKSKYVLPTNIVRPQLKGKNAFSGVRLPGSNQPVRAFNPSIVGPSTSSAITSTSTTTGTSSLPPAVRKPRPIIIDGSNVAMLHGHNVKFSCRGLELMVRKIQQDFGRTEIIIFVPRFRAKLRQSVDTHILDALEKEGILKYTPSREVGGRHVVSYDDRFILEYAVQTDGIIISNDQFKDLYNSEPAWRETISERLLQFTWVNDTLMFPNDPLGRNGPLLNEFLCFPIGREQKPKP